MPFSRQRVKQLLLVIGDLAVFQLSLVLTLFIRYGTVRQHDWELHAWPFAILNLLWVLGLYVANVYDLTIFREPFLMLRRYLEGMIANLVLGLAFFYLVPFFNIAPRTNLFLDFVIALLLSYAWRLAFRSFIFDSSSRGHVLYIGAVQDVKNVRDILTHSLLGLKLTAVVATQGEPETSDGLHWIRGFENFDETLQQEQISTIVLGARPDDVPGLKEALYRTLFTSVHLIDRAELEEETTGRIPLSYVNETWFLHHLREAEKTWYESFKRGTDVLLTLPFGLFALLTLPFLALAIKLSSRGPVFYSQLRIGKGGKTIRIWKYRTMRSDAEKNGPVFSASSKTDPRVTLIGRLMRQLRLDELPQLWNVLRGDLSFVGPRPERPEFVAPLEAQMPYYALRHLTRPGLTGWAQVLFLTPTSKLEDNLKKLQYDLFYIKRRSILLDVAILLKTIGIVLRRQGT